MLNRRFVLYDDYTDKFNLILSEYANKKGIKSMLCEIHDKTTHQILARKPSFEGAKKEVIKPLICISGSSNSQLKIDYFCENYTFYVN